MKLTLVCGILLICSQAALCASLSSELSQTTVSNGARKLKTFEDETYTTCADAKVGCAAECGGGTKIASFICDDSFYAFFFGGDVSCECAGKTPTLIDSLTSLPTYSGSPAGKTRTNSGSPAGKTPLYSGSPAGRSIANVLLAQVILGVALVLV